VDRAVQPGVDVYGLTASNPGTQYLAFSTDADDVKKIEIPSDFFSGGSLGSPVGIGVSGNSPIDVPYQVGQNLAPIDVDNAGLKIESNVVLTPFGYWGVVAVNNSTTGNNGIRWFQVDEQTGQQLASATIEDPVFHFFYPSGT